MPRLRLRLADSDGVHGDVRREQQLERFVVAVRVVLRVLPVGDQENNLAPVARPVAQLFRRGVNGVVDVFVVGMPQRTSRNLRRAVGGGRIDARPTRHRRGPDSRKRTAEVDALQLGEQRVVIGNEIRDGFGNFIKAPQRHLVGRAESSRERLQSFLNFVRRCFCFKSSSIRMAADKGKGIHREHRNRLLDPIFKDSEIILLEVGDQLPGVILDGDGHDHQGYRRANSRPGILGLARRRLVGSLGRGRSLRRLRA